MASVPSGSPQEWCPKVGARRRSSLHITAQSVIESKRKNERPHTAEEIEWFVSAFDDGEVTDYQMSAWLMGICLNGMTDAETATLTGAMVNSGTILDWSGLNVISVDKHSTGGVGDKVSIILAPLVASFGIAVPMMAGRSLGHTGGTIDKLESISGFRTDLSVQEFQHAVRTIGVAIVSPGPDMAPVDKKIYELRDVTSTVTSISLQASSIMSKKIAENPSSLVLDVKFGKGSFQKTVEESIELATSMIQTGERNGMPTTAFITRMDSPIGRSVGNWNEVLECITVLKTGKGSSDLVSLCLVEAAQMIIQGGLVPSGSLEEAVTIVNDHLVNGQAYLKFRQMVQAQGGDIGVIDSIENYPTAAYVANVLAPSSGYVSHIDAIEIGLTGITIGAGRVRSKEAVDATAGIWLHKKIGDKVMAGEVVATIETNIQEAVDVAAHRVTWAFAFSDNEVKAPPLITHIVTKDGVYDFPKSVSSILELYCAN